MSASNSQREAAEAVLLERLRSHRVHPERGRGLEPELLAFVKGVKRMSGQASRASEAWSAAAPDAVAAVSRVRDLRAGTLTVEIASSADRHAADRWLRTGGLDELRALAKAPLSRVRFELGG
ncbi:MAG: DciA family protein [Planctomycetota bacterium]